MKGITPTAAHVSDYLRDGRHTFANQENGCLQVIRCSHKMGRGGESDITLKG